MLGGSVAFLSPEKTIDDYAIAAIRKKLTRSHLRQI
jgi:hypothetical protein